MGELRANMVPFITKEEIQGMVKSIARDINNDFDGEELILICPLKGSVLFLSDLTREIVLPQQVDFVHLSSKKRGQIFITKDISTEITGKHVIIVEEIIDAGRKLSFLRNHLLSSNPKSISVVALIDKPSRRELPIKPDYVGKTIDDRFIVGYGMDSEEIGRNYPDIYSFAN